MFFRVQPNELSAEEAAAICIQAHFRGYLARKLFVQLLYEKFVKVGQKKHKQVTKLKK